MTNTVNQDGLRPILFVEDTSDTRFLVEYALQQEGLAVETAQTADEGLTLARQNKYSLILLDIGLPDKDGVALCREIRKYNSDTPIVFYSAFADLLDRHEAAAAGAQGALRKPEDTGRLGEHIRTFIKEKEAKR